MHITYRAETKYIFRMMTVDPTIKQSGLQPDMYNPEPTHLLFVSVWELGESIYSLLFIVWRVLNMP